MDPHTQNALRKKLALIHELGDDYIAFPNTPLSFARDDLRSIRFGAQTGRGLQILSELSRAINPIPNGTQKIGFAPPYLWSGLDNILSGEVKVAHGSNSEERRDELEKYRSVLRDKNGALTKRYQKYEYYSQFWRRTNIEFANRRIQVDFSSNIEVKKHWKRFEEPEFQKLINEIEINWDQRGFRSEIEFSINRINSIVSKQNPRILWNEWTTRLSFDRNGNSDADGVKFFRTVLIPGSFVDLDEMWIKLNLDREEILQLNQIGENIDEINVEEISFEYVLVNIYRPWFEPELFKSRIWYFKDRERITSDGGTPPSGELPGYVHTAIFIKNLTLFSADSDKGQEKKNTVIWPFPDIVVDLPIPPIGGTFSDDPVTDPLAPELNAIRNRLNDLRSDIEIKNESRKSAGFATTKRQPVKKAYFDGNVGLFAFVWTGFPKSPNPDMDLAWSAEEGKSRSENSARTNGTEPVIVTFGRLPAKRPTNKIFEVVIHFSKKVKLVKEKVSIVGGNIISFKKFCLQYYIIKVKPDEGADVTIRVGAGAVRDNAGNSNVAVEATSIYE